MRRQRVQAPSTHQQRQPTAPRQYPQRSLSQRANLDIIQNQRIATSARVTHARLVAAQVGNRRFGQLMRQIDLQRSPPDGDQADKEAGPKRQMSLINIFFNPTTREETALNRMIQYAGIHPQGPLSFLPDPTFQQRLYKSAGELLQQMQQYESFEKMPARLQAIVFTLEQLNYDKIIDPRDEEWMAAREEGDPGMRNEHRTGSTSGYGADKWKCNKFVADAYASTEGAGIRNKYPLTKGGGTWGPQANDFARGNKMKNFPVNELSVLAKDGTHVVEVLEYDERGKVIAKYTLDGKIFKKMEKIKGKWVETGETRNPEDLEPGHAADIGDIVAFQNVEGGSGHTGLNIGNDLFISAMNSTEGVGIVSIKQHIDPSIWDQYGKVTFRQYGR
jgi:hypothetical protein